MNTEEKIKILKTENETLKRDNKKLVKLVLEIKKLLTATVDN